MASETRAARRGAIKPGSVDSDGRLLGSLFSVGGSIILESGYVGKSGVIAVGAMLDRLWCNEIENSFAGRRAWLVGFSVCKRISKLGIVVSYVTMAVIEFNHCHLHHLMALLIWMLCRFSKSPDIVFSYYAKFSNQ